MWLHSNGLSLLGLGPQTITSDAVTGAGIPIDGFQRAHALVAWGAGSTSDAVLTITFEKNTVTNVASDAVASDWTTVKAMSATTALAATTSYEALGYYIDLNKHGISTGLLRTSTISNTTLTANLSVVWVLTRANQRLPDTDNITWTEVAT